jgi:tetratricopeptide (TPR) repeat protein
MTTTFSDSASNLDKKELKRPDAFQASGAGVVKKARSQQSLWIGFAVAGLAVVGAWSAWSSYRDSQAKKAGELLYSARLAEEKEIQAQLPKAATPEKGKKTEAETASTSAALESEKLDLASRFPETLKAYQAVISQYPSTQASVEARLSLGRRYLNHGQAAQAVPLFEEAAKKASGADRASAWNAAGYAYEASAQSPQAIQAFEKAANEAPKGIDTIRGDSLVSEARVLEASNDSARAKQVYERILKELPNSEFSKAAEIAKSRLP